MTLYIDKGILTRPSASSGCSSTSVETTSSQETFDNDWISTLTVSAVNEKLISEISPLATYILSHTNQSSKSLQELQSGYHSVSDIKITLPDLFTYCQLLERRNLVKIESGVSNQRAKDKLIDLRRLVFYKSGCPEVLKFSSFFNRFWQPLN